LQSENYAAYTYREYQNGDQAALEKLLRSTFPRFNEDNMWAWKYKSNPSFDNSLVILAEKDGELIGCNYWMQRDLKLLANMQVKAALGADVAVYPNHRKFGVGKELLRYPRNSGIYKEKNLLLSYMFGRPELSTRFYKPVAGYILAPSCTSTYRKLFNCKELKDAFFKIDNAIKSNEAIKNKLKKITLRISFRLRGTPEFSINFEEGSVYLEEGKAEKSDMLIEGNLPLSFLIIGGEGGLSDLVKFLITGKVKIKKGLFHVFRLRKIFVLFKTALNQAQRN
jgi:predicted N-acetyltransferase YhbS